MDLPPQKHSLDTQNGMQLSINFGPLPFHLRPSISVLSQTLLLSHSLAVSTAKAMSISECNNSSGVEPTDLTDYENGKPGFDKRTLPSEWKFGVKLQNVMDDSIYQYMLNTFTFHREHDASKELWQRTWKLTQRGEMMTLPDQVQFLRLMVKMSGARRALEIGVFTGYSLLNIALALPPDGKVVAVDPGEDPKFGWPCIVNAGVANKVEIKQTTGLEYLDSLVEKGERDCFDFAFVDADKVNYVNYHSRLMKLVRVGGLIIYDDTLWFGLVGGKDPHNLLQNDYMRESLSGIKAINSTVAADPNLEVATIFMGYGVTLCYRIA